MYVPPETPSKWDIIPVHNSDRGSFRRCRRYWDWSSPARQNLMIRADVYGVNSALWFGTGIHYALEQYYTPGLRRDPVEAWREWFDIQWRGGIVTTEWLPRVYDLKPRSLGEQTPQGRDPEGELWVVRGLEDILPDPDHQEFDELFVLGNEMMRFYKEYSTKNDDFEVFLPEHDFSIPIWDYENNCILKAVDTREDSPNYGKLLEVHARGRQDLILQRHGSPVLGLMDHKTAAAIGEDYFRKLETDEQCTTYLAVAQVEANYYDLPHKGKPFEDIIYNVLRKAYPKPPTILKNGMFSVNRTEESTTYDMLSRWIKENLSDVVPLTEKQQNYLDYLRNVGDEQFIIRTPVRRNQAQLKNALYRMYLEAMDMLSTPRVYPNISNDWLCLNCQFRAPCLAKEDGSDWEQLIADNYTTHKDR